MVWIAAWCASRSARILSVADTVEAMAFDRPYRRASQPSAIVAEVQSQSGRQFDPVIVSAFVHVVERHGGAVIVNSVRSHAPESAYGQSAPLWGLALSAARRSVGLKRRHD